MFELNSYLSELDKIYASRQAGLAEEYLKKGLKSAASAQDESAILVILNELMGYYRAAGRHEEALLCADQARSLAEGMGLSGTVNFGTTLLNAATAYRAAGRYEEALAFYRETERIFREQMELPDYRMATLYNNLSILYSETGRLAEAKAELEAAMEMIRQLDRSEVETAITHTNLGLLCFRMRSEEEGIRHMEEAVGIFRSHPDSKDSHYASALAGLAEARFRQDRYEESIALYEEALREILECYGENDYYRITAQNLETVKDLYRRRSAFAQEKTGGLARARAYYEAYGRKLVEEKYPEYAKRIAAGLAGEGSECSGFDDAVSTDHDYGAGFCLWLTPEDYAAVGERLMQDYCALPGEFGAFPARNGTPQGARRVGVFDGEQFLTGLLEDHPIPEARTDGELLSEEQERLWLSIPESALFQAVNGEVFADPSGFFTALRARIAYYPEPVRLKKLALALAAASQAGQYNLGRAAKRGDVGAMFFARAEFCRQAADSIYLLNRAYAPYYKWKLRGIRSLKRLGGIAEDFERLMELPLSSPEVPVRIEEICGQIARELYRQNLTRTPDGDLESQKSEVLRALLADTIVRTEWAQFQNVRNEGGRADCQDNWETFEIMRKSQFLTWKTPALKSYLADLQNAEAQGWNLLTEKYARMMESTAPAEFEQLKGALPERSRERKEVQEEIIRQEILWAKRFALRFPNLSGRGRAITTDEDKPWNTSMETYLRGELGTYSDRTIALYREMIASYAREGKNLTQMKLFYMTRFYGYASLSRAEEAAREENERMAGERS